MEVIYISINYFMYLSFHIILTIHNYHTNINYPNRKYFLKQILHFFTGTMKKFVCVKDYEQQALKILTPLARDYYKDGAGEENSLKWNKEAFTKFV